MRKATLKAAVVTVRKIDAKVEQSLRSGYIATLLTLIASRKGGFTKPEATEKNPRCAQSFHDELKFCIFNEIIPDRTREGMQYRYTVPNLKASLKALDSHTLSIRPAEFVFDDANSNSKAAKMKTAKVEGLFSAENRANLKFVSTPQQTAAIEAYKAAHKPAKKAAHKPAKKTVKA